MFHLFIIKELIVKIIISHSPLDVLVGKKYVHTMREY